MGLFILLITFIILFPITFIKKQYRKIYVKVYICCSFIILCLISGGRAKSVGTDTWMFVRVFENVNTFSDAFKLYTDRFELGYRIYNAIIKVIFNDYHALLIISSLITIGLFYKFFCEKSKYPYLSIIMFVLLMYFCNSMCLMRQYMAVSIGCLAISKLSEGKKLKFIIYTCLAALFHSSAAVLFILLFIKNIKINEVNKFKLILISLFAVVIANKIIGVVIVFFPQYSAYLTSEKYYLQNQIGSILKATIQCLLFFLVNMYYKSEESEFDKIGYICSLISMAISIVSISGAILSRMALYFSIVNCVTVPNTIYKIKNNKTKISIVGGLILFGTMYYMVILIYRPQWSGVLPYTFWS